MSSEKYCADMVNNVEGALDKKGLNFLSKCVIPLKHRYSTELCLTRYLMSGGLQWYQ